MATTRAADLSELGPSGIDLERADTKTIKARFRTVGRTVLCSGTISAMMHFILCTCLVWYSTTIPERCAFAKVFLTLGLSNGLLACALALVSVAGRDMIDAQLHAKLAEKYRHEGREEEASASESTSEAEVIRSSRLVTIPALLYVLAQLGVVACWLWGWYVALVGGGEGASAAACADATHVFFWLVLLNAVGACLSMCGSSGAAFSYGNY
eukprot:TRINITY_DN12733_c0_g1_i1.p1 TRINITY_DN12733_c0_g1~~TRINITY_DN12733_c0_g1_i1.p1  ORF type:complete len:226 (+),score=39.13 TRINITY_DN12733_c0_g1_i1:48-680(+)